MQAAGVAGFFGAKDVPGDNRIGAVVHDEELFATELVTCVGQVCCAAARGRIVSEACGIRARRSLIVSLNLLPKRQTRTLCSQATLRMNRPTPAA